MKFVEINVRNVKRHVRRFDLNERQSSRPPIRQSQNEKNTKRKWKRIRPKEREANSWFEVIVFMRKEGKSTCICNRIDEATLFFRSHKTIYSLRENHMLCLWFKMCLMWKLAEQFFDHFESKKTTKQNKDCYKLRNKRTKTKKIIKSNNRYNIIQRCYQNESTFGMLW